MAADGAGPGGLAAAEHMTKAERTARAKLAAAASAKLIGEPGGTRTRDPLLKRQML